MDPSQANANVRRRHNISRHSREQTPEPSRGERQKLIVDANNNAVLPKEGYMADPIAAQNNDKYIVKGILNLAHPVSASSSTVSSGSHAYRAKLLSKKEKTFAAASHRSHSNTSRQDTPKRSEGSSQTNDEIFSFMRQAKRSLSAPRKREGSVESGKLTPQMQQQRISLIDTENYRLSNKTSDNEEKNAMLDRNLFKFNEERRKFELEKLKFLEEKKELDRMRLNRFQRYNKEAESIDDKQPRLARKIVMGYEEAVKSAAEAAVLASPETESETDETNDIAVIEHVVRPPNAKNDKNLDENNNNVVGHEKLLNGEITHQNDSIEVSELNGQMPAKGPSIKQEFSSNGKLAIDEECILEQSDPLLNSKILQKETDKTMKEIKIKEQENGPETQDIKLATIELDGDKPIKLSYLIKVLLKEAIQVWRIHKIKNISQWRIIKHGMRSCMAKLLILVIYCGLGGLLFRFVEGNFENIYKCSVKRVKRDFIDQLWQSSHNLREDDWKSMARSRLRIFEEELNTSFEAGVRSYSGHTAWNFVNGVLYSLTVITTIGYGHISPSTYTGRAITIIYAIFGIPIFLILLADFGKLFTRAIKFFWSYVRRLYYTGSCRKVRKTAQAQEMMRGLNVMYDFVRKPSLAFDSHVAASNLAQPGQAPQSPMSYLSVPTTICDSPTTPIPDNYEINDDFNLPVSVAFCILIAYLVFGASIFYVWEDWSFFDSFYFVFISISTIGLGDFVPKHPLVLMLSIVYLMFGLALTSMCINVIQLKLSDSFRQASKKIGTTIGLLQMAEAASQNSQSHQSTPQSLAGTSQEKKC